MMAVSDRAPNRVYATNQLFDATTAITRRPAALRAARPTPLVTRRHRTPKACGAPVAGTRVATSRGADWLHANKVNATSHASGRATHFTQHTEIYPALDTIMSAYLVIPHRWRHLSAVVREKHLLQDVLALFEYFHTAR
ncbi:hypothetical protein B5X24_HaOG210436 [Helicoverpa armigera]|nr:hypothetical protein B5X24_HaOG210436 [Helicoverpa armigera]